MFIFLKKKGGGQQLIYRDLAHGEICIGTDWFKTRDCRSSLV